MLGKLWLLPDKVKSVKAIGFLFWRGRRAQLNEGIIGGPAPWQSPGPRSRLSRPRQYVEYICRMYDKENV